MLYNGRIYPPEEILLQDEKYKDAEKKANDLFGSLHSRMNEEDQKQLEEMRDLMYECQSYTDEENFRYGLTLGVMLMHEIYEVYGEKYFKSKE